MACPHPFKTERIGFAACEGQTIKEILAQVQADPVLLRAARICVDTEEIPESRWATFAPPAGSQVTVRVVPEGGDDSGKTAVRLVLSIAVLAVALWAGAVAGPLIAGAGTGGQVAGGVVTAVIGFGGTLAINSLIPPPRPELEDRGKDVSRSLSLIEGARNEARPFGAVPRVLGTVRMIPPFAALPYSELSSDVDGAAIQFFHMLFCWGYGPVQVQDFKIGETDVDDFGDDIQIETHDGDGSTPVFEHFTNDVFEESMNIKLEQSAGYSIRTTQPDTDEVQIDLTFPGLLEISGSGDKLARQVELRVEYSVTGANDWKVPTGGLTLAAREAPFPPLNPSRTRRASFRTRRDSLALNRFTGALKWFKGNPKNPGSSPNQPGLNSKWWRLCNVLRTTGDTAITSGMITDKRQSDWPFGDDDPETSIGGEFLCTAQSPATAFIDVAGGDLFFDRFITLAKTPSGFVRSISIRFDARGQYDIRVRRETADSSSSRVIDEVFWSGLRSIKHDAPVLRGDFAYTALRIKATDVLQGIVDTFNAVVTSVVQDWDGVSAWETIGSNNPASLFREILQGKANARSLPDSRIDLPALQAWHDVCEANLRSFNFVYDFTSNVNDVLNQVAAAGRASKTIVDGKWSIILDQTQSVPIQHFSEKNSWGFQSQLIYPNLPHALDVRFQNELKGFRQDNRVVYDEGYDVSNATIFEELEFPGVTHPDKVWEEARYMLATARLRRESYSFHCDIENIVCTRGDLVRLQHSVPLFGLASGRVTAIQTDNGNTTGVTVDESLTMIAGGAYTLRFRLDDGTSLTRVLVTVPGEQTTVTFVTPITTSSGPAVGDFFLYGPSSQESVQMLVKKVIPGTDFSAMIECIDYAPAVYTSDIGPIPAFDSQITIPPGFNKPIVDNVRSDETVLFRSTDGTLNSQILITLSSVSNAPATVAAVQAQYRVKDTDAPYLFTPEVPRESKEVSISPVEDEVEYEFRLRYRYHDGRFGDWTALQNHVVIGKTSEPSDVMGFTATPLIGSGSVELCWDEISEIDREYYQIREGGSDWATAAIVANVEATCLVVDGYTGSKTFRIKAVDMAGNFSANAASITFAPTVPGTPQVTLTFDGPDFVLRWTATAGSFPIDYYEVRRGGTTWDNATVVAAQIHTTEYRNEVTWVGSETWRVRAFGVAGAQSATPSVTVVSPALPVMNSITPTVIDSTAVLRWSATKGSLPITEYEIRKGAIFASAEVIGITFSTFKTVVETTGGEKVYWIFARDSAGNVSVELSRTVTLDPPPDFALEQALTLDYAGVTATDVLEEASVSRLLAPVRKGRSWSDHFSLNSWGDIADQLTAGYSRFIQDATANTTATYEETWDLPSLISAARLVLDYKKTDLEGGVTVTPTISYKTNLGDGWTDGTAGSTDVFATNFQYVKLKFAFTVDTDNKDLCEITDVSIAIRRKIKTDQGTITVTGNPETVDLNVTFQSLISVDLTPVATAARIAVYDAIDETQFDVYLFDDTGAAATGDVHWIVRGY